MPFVPQLHTTNRGRSIGNGLTTTQSVLKLAQDPAYHLEWKRNKIINKDIYRKTELLKREQEELSLCTFTPTTIDCPEYIRRIAQSMSVVKSARGGGNIGQGKIEKPDWK